LDRSVIEAHAEWFAHQHQVSPKRTACVLARIEESRAFRHAPIAELARASSALGVENALELFELEKPVYLGLLTVTYDVLASPLTPLMTLEQLETNTNSCAAFLCAESNELLATGLPSRPFTESAWLDWHLGRLFFIKRPIEFAHASPVGQMMLAAVPPGAPVETTDDRSRFWTRNRPRPPFALEYRDVQLYRIGGRKLARSAQAPFRFSILTDQVFRDDDGSAVSFCSPDDAGHIKDLTTRGMSLLESLRTPFLDVRMRCLDVLSRALAGGGSSCIWPECAAILQQALTAKRMDDFAVTDALYGKSPSDWPPAWMMDGYYRFFDNPASLDDLLDVIVHTEREIAVGTLTKTCEEFPGREEMLRAPSYYHAIAGVSSNDLAGLLCTHVFRSREGDAYTTTQAERIHALWPQLAVEVAHAVRVPQAMVVRAEEYLRRAGRCIEGSATTAMNTSLFPFEQHRVEEVPNAENVFRKQGDKWRVVFADAEAFVDDLKGMRYIHDLLERPGHEIPSLTLASAPSGPGHPSYLQMSVEELLRETLGVTDIDGAMAAIAAADSRVFDAAAEGKESELASARANGEAALAASLVEQVQGLKKLRSQLFGLHGRERQPADQREKARIAVKKAIARAIARLPQPLQRHLDASIKTGHRCSYSPSEPEAIEWDLG